MPPKTQTSRQRPTAPTRGRRRTTSPRALIVVSGLVVAAIAAGVFLVSRRSDSAAAPVIAHVHGLGINPADGSLHVATHNGTFRLAGDRPVERVGESAQDTMGFTVIGPDHFLGSGHPDAAGFRQGKPARLGLIESTDAGATWASRSLSGEVDFHALAASQGTTYGLDSGTDRLLASTNNAFTNDAFTTNVEWETRSTVKIFGFAVDPARVDHLVAGAPEGTLDSSDGGRTWRPIGGAPRLIALSWAPSGTLWGVDQTGAAHRSTDGGATWQMAGRVDGEPEALLATDDRLVVAVATPGGRTAIYQSIDAGRSWQTRYQSPG